MHKDKALVTGAALKKIILDRLPHKILEQMHTIDRTGKTNIGIITIITIASRTVEKWDEANKNLGLRKSISDVGNEVRKTPRLGKESRFNKPKSFENKFQGRRNNQNQSDQKFKPKNECNKTYAEQSQEINKSELD